MLTFQLQFGTTGGTLSLQCTGRYQVSIQSLPGWEMVTKLAYKPVGLLSPIRITMNCVA